MTAQRSTSCKTCNNHTFESIPGRFLNADLEAHLIYFRCIDCDKLIQTVENDQFVRYDL
ncbi:hypothetical protein AB6D11_02520 [Vibrio splendidus]